jgi:hypothetical protein
MMRTHLTRTKRAMHGFWSEIKWVGRRVVARAIKLSGGAVLWSHVVRLPSSVSLFMAIAIYIYIYRSACIIYILSVFKLLSWLIF